MGGERTTGGWFRTPPALQPRWEAFDLPARTTLEGAADRAAEPAPPSTRRCARVSSPWPRVVVVAGRARAPSP